MTRRKRSQNTRKKNPHVGLMQSSSREFRKSNRMRENHNSLSPTSGFDNPPHERNSSGGKSDLHVSKSLDLLFDDIATEKSFFHQLEVIQGLGNLVDRINTTMQYVSKHHFISAESALKIARQMNRSGWGVGSTHQVGNVTIPKQNRGNSRKVEGFQKSPELSGRNSPKYKIKPSRSDILEQIGYGRSEKRDVVGLSSLNECSRALGVHELNPAESSFPFRVLLPRKEIPERGRRVRPHPYVPSSHLHYRENRTSRLRAEYVSRNSPNNTEVDVSACSSRPTSGNASSTSVQCKLTQEIYSDVQMGAGKDDCINGSIDVYCSTTDLTKELELEQNSSRWEFSKLKKDSMSQTAISKIEDDGNLDERATQTDVPFIVKDFSEQVDLSTTSLVQPGMEYPENDTMRPFTQTDLSTTRLFQSDMEYAENDTLQPFTQTHFRNAIESESSKDIYEEMMKFKIQAEAQQMKDYYFWLQNAAAAQQSTSTAFSLSSLPTSPLSSSTLTAYENAVYGSSRASLSVSSYGSGGDINVHDNSETSIKECAKAQSNPGSPSPSESFLNILNCNLKEVDCFHSQRKLSSAMSSDDNEDEDFRMLLGLVGFPEIVREKIRSNKESPAPAVPTITSHDRCQKQRVMGYYTPMDCLDSCFHCENWLLEDPRYQNLTDEFQFLASLRMSDSPSYQPQLINKIQASISKELLSDDVLSLEEID